MVIPRTFSPSRGDRVRWHAETNYGQSVSCRPGSIMSNKTQRQIMAILHLLPSRGGGPDDTRRQIMVILLTFPPFRHSRVRWHAETNYGHSASFAIQRQPCWMARRDILWSFYAFCHPEAASPMTCEDKLWSFRTFSPSGDNCVRWHAETNYGHCVTFVIQRRRAR